MARMMLQPLPRSGISVTSDDNAARETNLPCGDASISSVNPPTLYPIRSAQSVTLPNQAARSLRLFTGRTYFLTAGLLNELGKLVGAMTGAGACPFDV